jgi:tripeptidyl-peptidase I
MNQAYRSGGNAVSDPSHHRYGQYLTAPEIDDLIQPHADSLVFIEEWLQGHGIADQDMEYSKSQDWISLLLPIEAIETLLQTEYFIFKNQDSVEVVRAPKWSLPDHLHEHIDVIQPTNSFFHAGLKRNLVGRKPPARATTTNGKRDENPPHTTDFNQVATEFEDDGTLLDLKNLPSDLTTSQACNVSAVTPLCLRVLYGTFNYKAQAFEKNQIGVVNFNNEFNNRSDINLFLESYRPEAVSAAFSFKTESVGGGVNQQTPATKAQLEHGVGKEGNLDAEALLGIGYPTPLLAWSVAHTTSETDELYLSWLQYLLAQPTLPSVISISYADIESSLPYSYASRVCNLFLQLGARGVSVITGSGDWGVGTNSATSCPATMPSLTKASSGHEFEVHFPDSCPYITSVGATRGIPQVVAHNPDNGFVSGGGFSKYFPRPAYQDKAVSQYLENLGTKHEGWYNRNGRGYPDLAAQGYRLATVWNGTKRLVDGTSASAPIMAAVVALVNDALIAEGKPTLGFLNPWLYGGGWKAFSDVTSGESAGCNTTGFPATVGWDPVSGFGTPVSGTLLI